MKKRVWIGVVLAVGVVAVIYQIGSDRGNPPAGQEASRPAYVAAEGKVEAMPGFDVDLSTGELNGRIAKILVKEGDPVTRGQLVAVLENEDLAAQVTRSQRELAVAKRRLIELESGARDEEIAAAAASLRGTQANLDEARKRLARNRELRRQRLISQATLDEAVAGFKAAEAAVEEAAQHKQLLEKGPKTETVQLYREQVRLAQAALDYHRKQLDRTEIRSPITGTIIQRYLDEGEGVTPEIPILAIADLSKLWVNAEVDETDVGRVHSGDPVQVRSNAYPGITYAGTVVEIANYAGAREVRPRDPTVNLGLKTVQVKVELRQHTPLKLGMTVDIKIVPNDE